MTRAWERRQPWSQAYRAAIHELDRTQLSSRIEAARKAIDLRIAELWCSRAEDMSELDTLQDALKILRLLEEQEPFRKEIA